MVLSDGALTELAKAADITGILRYLWFIKTDLRVRFNHQLLFAFVRKPIRNAWFFV